MAALPDDKIDILVKLSMNANKGINFHVSRNETVERFIQMIKDKEGPQVADVRLLFHAKPMRVKNDNGGLCKLSDYDCYNNCTIFAVVIAGKIADDKIDIFVRLDMNKCISLRVSQNQTVEELVQMIKDKEGPQVSDIRLICGAKPMHVKKPQGSAVQAV